MEEPEPWNEDRYQPRGREKEVYWFLYLGELDLKEATRSLLRLFPDDQAEERIGARGTVPIAVVVLDQQGRPVEESTFLASFAWGYGQVLRGRVEGLSDFLEAEHALRRDLESVLIQTEDEEILPATAADVERCTEWLISRLGLPAEEVLAGGVAQRVPQWRRSVEPPTPQLLNSFFLEDLARVRSAIRNNEAGPALRAFLDLAPRPQPADVVRQQGLVEETVVPARIPWIRWPVAGDFPLVLMQQAAVNHASEDLADGGLVGVNGPPGTGKTTLLRDVVAKVVLDRAMAMAKYKDPNDAFQHCAPIKLGRAFLHLYELDDALLGHEIVVASSNNKAVENVSREIPVSEAIDDSLHGNLNYFQSVSDNVAADGREEDLQVGRTWGLAAAVLGNSANRSAFSRSFWWDQDRGMQTYLRTVVEGWDARQEKSGDLQTVVTEELPPRGPDEARKRWRKQRQHFLNVLGRCRDIAAILEQGRQASLRLPKMMTALQDQKAVVEQWEERLAREKEEEQRANRILKTKEEERRLIHQEKEAHAEQRPGCIAQISDRERCVKWEEKASRIAQALEQAEQGYSQARQQYEAVRSKVAGSFETLQKTEKNLRDLRAEHATLISTVQKAETEAGGPLPNQDYWQQDEEDLQRASPWLYPSFQAKRSELFAAAFSLHRAFIDAAAKPIRNNLGVAMALMNGRSLTDKQEPARRSVWSTLFLTVPVISTTFASVDRLFGPLGREQLGWLLIDEAGQAVPQAAVGAIWRSQRVLAIGDPLQIEPVVTLAPKLVTALFDDLEVEVDSWAPPGVSVQSLADRATWFGTEVSNVEGSIWVGSPLRVHRRCQEPMFTISNRVAYDGLMVHAVSDSPSAVGKVLGESRWIDLQGAASSKWVPDEGVEAVSMLRKLVRAGLAEADIFFITPFRIVAQELRKAIRSSDIATHLPEKPWEWVSERVGTVHTFQGKEAEAVVLVLGASQDFSRGARYWAGGQPNLLNVAVSRAKKRLYVIGDRQAWKDAGVFRTLAKALP